MAELFLNGKVELRPGDCRDRIREMPDNSIDSVCTDPPYALVSITKRFGGENAAPANDGDVYARASSGFMGKQWDTGETAFATDFWAGVLRVLKPGGHVVAFSGTRTYHRMAVAIEDAGFEIRDQLAWMYGSGFPKSHDVSKGIDKAAGAERATVRDYNPRNPKATGGGKDGMEGATRPWIEAAMERGYHEKAGNEPATEAAREWQGWGTALKPAWEPICLARKPLSEKSVAANVLKWGTGALNIDGCRIETEENLNGGAYSGGDKRAEDASSYVTGTNAGEFVQPTGRWPANIAHDGSEEVLAGFPETKGQIGGNNDPNGSLGYHGGARGISKPGIPDSGSAARFFYTAKADAFDRISSKHPTVKPVDLMQWLTRLITPPGGLTLDPFAGSGTTGEAAFIEGFRAILIEREAEYCDDIRKRLEMVLSSTERRKQESKRRQEFKPADDDIFLM